LSSHSFEYRTVIVNTKVSPINITIVSILPRSTDKKISVTLQKPDPKNLQKIRSSHDTSVFLGALGAEKGSTVAGKAQMAQNDVTNNIILSTTVGGRNETEIPFQYTVQWPAEDGYYDVEVVRNDLY